MAFGIEKEQSEKNDEKKTAKATKAVTPSVA